jgi:hypothetical protein
MCNNFCDHVVPEPPKADITPSVLRDMMADYLTLREELFRTQERYLDRFELIERDIKELRRLSGSCDCFVCSQI